MSYARPSETGSDIYVYGSRDAIHVHVAFNRGSANTVPQPQPGAPEGEWQAFFDDVVEWDHPEAGQSYVFTSYSECLRKLEELRASGVGVPQRAFDLLEQDSKDGDRYAA